MGTGLLALLLLGIFDRAASGGIQRSSASLMVRAVDPSAPSATDAVPSPQAATLQASKAPRASNASTNNSVKDSVNNTLAASVEAKTALLQGNVNQEQHREQRKATSFSRTYTVFSLSPQEVEQTIKFTKANSVLQQVSPAYQKQPVSAVYEPLHMIFSTNADESSDAKGLILEEVTADGDTEAVSNPLKISEAVKASMNKAADKPAAVVLDPVAHVKAVNNVSEQTISLPAKSVSHVGSAQNVASAAKDATSSPEQNNVSEDILILNATTVAGTDASGAQTANSTYQTTQTTVVSSWVLVGMMGNFGVPLADSEKPWIVRGIRDALADSLEVCRSSVTLVDVRGLNVVPFSTLPSSGPTTVSPAAAIRTDDSALGASMGALQVLKSMLTHRSAIKAKNHGRDPFDSMNITRIRATYEVRIFPAMRATVPQVARRIDLLQSYSRFNDLSRMVATTLAASAGPVKGESISVVLDDLGYGSVHYLDRGDMKTDDLEDCIEEGRLYDARNVHKYVVGLSMILIILTTCAGSSVFAMKQPNIVPSRINPLMGPSG